jgi:hypothetical protein
MATISPPGCIVLAGLVFAAAGLRLAVRERRGPLAAAFGALSLVLALGVAFPGRLPDPIVDRVKTMTPDRAPDVRFSRWSPVFRVDVIENAPSAPARLAHDGMGLDAARYDGDRPRSPADDTDRPAFALLPPHHGSPSSAGGGNGSWPRSTSTPRASRASS